MTLRLREIDARQRIVRQGVVEAGVPFEVVGVVAEEVHRLLRLAQRLHAVLAHLERERRGDFVDALLHDVGDPPQLARALRPPASRARPGRPPAPHASPRRRGRRRRPRTRPARSSLSIGLRRATSPGQACRRRRRTARGAARAASAPGAAPRRSARAFLRRVEHRRVGQAKAHDDVPCSFRRGNDATAAGPAGPARGEVALADDQRRRQQDQVAARAEGNALGHRASAAGPRASGGVCGQGASGSRVARSRTSSSTANRPWPPRTSPITACGRASARAGRAGARRACASARSGPRPDTHRSRRRRPRRTGVAAIGETGVEHLVLEPRRNVRGDAPPRPAAACAPVSPLASVIMSGRPASP